MKDQKETQSLASFVKESKVNVLTTTQETQVVGGWWRWKKAAAKKYGKKITKSSSVVGYCPAY